MKDDSLKAFALDQLRGLGEVDCRAMFGGFGFYARDNFFGIIYKGRLYFKTNDATRADYIARGMKAFRPKPNQKLGNYFEVPPDVMEDSAQLEAWAREAAGSASK
jgi:DNA transformation protein